MSDPKIDDNGKFSIIEKIKKNKKLQVVLIVVVFLVVICIFSSNLFVKEESTNSTNINDYVTNLENRLENALSKVSGVGNVSVIITIESGMKTVLATEILTKESASGKEITETPIIVNGKTVVLCEEYPNIVGVLIVSQGANNLTVRTKIQQATVSLLNININQIEILTMK